MGTALFLNLYVKELFKFEVKDLLWFLHKEFFYYIEEIIIKCIIKCLKCNYQIKNCRVWKFSFFSNIIYKIWYPNISIYKKKKSKLFKKNAIVKKKGHCYLRKDTLCIYL